MIIKLLPLFLFFLLQSTCCQAQEEKEKFALPMELGQGFAKAEDHTHYLLSFSITPMLGFQSNKMNRWRAGIVFNYYNTNPGDDFSFGARIGYRLNKTGKLGNVFNFWLYPEYTVGTVYNAGYIPHRVSVGVISEDFLAKNLSLDLDLFYSFADHPSTGPGLIFAVWYKL